VDENGTLTPGHRNDSMIHAHGLLNNIDNIIYNDYSCLSARGKLVTMDQGDRKLIINN